jgi:sulfatase modifying factor 1
VQKISESSADALAKSDLRVSPRHVSIIWTLAQGVPDWPALSRKRRPHTNYLRSLMLGLAAMTALSAPLVANDHPIPEGMALIPAGEFTMGSDDGLYDEAPAHRVQLSAYFMDVHEVTNAQFAAFVRATHAVDTVEGSWFRFSIEGCVDLLAHYEERYQVSCAALASRTTKGEAEQLLLERDALRWRSGIAALRVLLTTHSALADESATTLHALPEVQTLIRDQAALPARCVTWHDAAAYAHWAMKRLPTEAEWEKAARGTDARIYPWGSIWDATKCRSGLSVDAGPATVGSIPEGASPYGCLDMAGNVWEWCEDWYGPATYTQTDRGPDPKGHAGLANGELPRQDPNAKLFRESKQGRETDTRKVLRGGCWVGGAIGQTEFNTRCSRRLWSNPNYWSPDTGFRCAKDSK